MKTIQQHREELGELIKQSQAFQENKENYTDANIDDGVFTEDAFTAFDALSETIEAKSKHVAALERTERTVAPVDAPPVRETVPAAPINHESPEHSGRNGFENMGEYATAVMKAGGPTGHKDPRLLHPDAAGATTFGSEGTGSEGGFLVPEQFSNEIMQLALEQDSLMVMTRNFPVTGNSMKFPTSETTPWGTNGNRTYWEAEAAKATESKPDLKRVKLELYKLMSLSPVTDEMLEDGRVLERFISEEIAKSIRWKTNDSIVNGTGAGQPQGFVTSNALLSVPKVTSQTADTINATNVAKMYASMPAGMVSTSAWLIAPDAFHQLIVMTVGNAPIWTPPNAGLKNAPAGLLLGRPIIMSQSCQTIGDEGDIYFVDLKSYLTISKAGGVKTDTSIHLYFDYGQTAFRTTFRMDGKPWMQDTIDQPNSSVDLSPFVTLAARA